MYKISLKKSRAKQIRPGLVKFKFGKLKIIVNFEFIPNWIKKKSQIYVFFTVVYHT